MSLIRKLSIGQNYMGDNVMHFIVGRKAYGEYNVHEIEQKDNGDVEVFIINPKTKEVIPWKYFNSNVAMQVEYSMEYDSESAK